MADCYCPLYGFSPPCLKCMWAIHDEENQKVTCSVTHIASAVLLGGKHPNIPMLKKEN